MENPVPGLRLGIHNPQNVQDMNEERDEAAIEHEGTEDRLAVQEGLAAAVSAIDIHAFDRLGLEHGDHREQQHDD